MPLEKEKCSICKKQYSFQGNNTMSEHMAKHALERRFQCEHCEKYFSTKTVLKYHNRTHTGERPFSCKYCPQSFGDRGNRNQHEAKHVNGFSVHQNERSGRREIREGKNEKVKCKLCGKELTKMAMSVHIQRHLGTFSCNTFGREFNAKSTMQKHISTVHQGKKKEVKGDDKKDTSKCEVCGEQITTKGMSTHVKRHSETFSCDTCHQKFHDKYSMKRHISIVHLKVRPFSCEICSKSFPLKNALKEHTNIHKGLEYPCDQCSHTAKTSKYLDSHKREMHSAKQSRRTSTCNMCQKSFHSDSLKRHILLVHTEDRPFSCKICFKKYALQSMLNTHMKETHLK